MEKVYVTQEGFDKLQADLRHEIDVVKPEILQELADARALGDLSENADYSAAKEKQKAVEDRIAILTEQVENAVIIKVSKDVKEVGLGTYVLLHMDLNNKDVQYHIVGTTETNPLEFKISNECDLSKAIIGHHVGDVVEVNANKPYKVTIKAISFQPMI